MYKIVNISKQDIVKSFENCCGLEAINQQEDNCFENSIIEEYSINNRTTLKVRIYIEKDKNGNPYYLSNVGVHRCSQILQELSAYQWDGEIPLNARNIINRLYLLVCEDSSEVSMEDKISIICKNSESYIRNIVYYLTNNIVLISRWAGGSKSNIENDCEFEADLNLFNSVSKENVEKVLNDLCNKYNAKWVLL